MSRQSDPMSSSAWVLGLVEWDLDGKPNSTRLGGLEEMEGEQSEGVWVSSSIEAGAMNRSRLEGRWKLS